MIFLSGKIIIQRVQELTVFLEEIQRIVYFLNRHYLFMIINSRIKISSKSEKETQIKLIYSTGSKRGTYSG